MLERSAVQAFGTSEYALRLFPFLCGVISLLLFYRVAERFVAPKAVPIALGLFAILNPLIYYSSEVKQYSSDVAIALLLLLAAIYYESCELTSWRVALFGLLGAASIWFSHPSILILAGLGLSLTSFCIARRRWARIARLSAVYSLWTLSLALCYLISLRYLSNNKFFQYYWDFGFVPYPPVSRAAVSWFMNTFLEVFRNPGGLEVPGIGALAFLVGCLSMFSNKKEKLFILVSPIFVTLLAAGFHKYPFANRLVLFIVPLLVLFIAEGVHQIWSKTANETSIIGMCLIGLLFFQPFFLSSYRLIKPRMREEIKPVMNYVKDHEQEGDVLYVHWRAGPAFRYYTRRFNLSKTTIIQGSYTEDRWEKYEKDLDQLCGYRRVWVLFAGTTSVSSHEEKLFLYFLDKRGARLDSFRDEGAVVHLYDLDKSSGNW
jgi:hypothetical protein